MERAGPRISIGDAASLAGLIPQGLTGQVKEDGVICRVLQLQHQHGLWTYGIDESCRS